jgi:hypothetical protein
MHYFPSFRTPRMPCRSRPFLLAARPGGWLTFLTQHDFWIEHGIGRRVCALIDATRQMEPALLTSGQPLREQIERLLPGMVRIGVAEAARQRPPKAGLGDFQGGLRLDAAPFRREREPGDEQAGRERNVRLFADAVYNSRSGKVNFVDSIRRFKDTRHVNVGDGFESIDGSVTTDVFIGTARFAFVLASFSHTLDERFSSSERILSSGALTSTIEIQEVRVERGDFSQILAGIGRKDGGNSDLRAWIGYQRVPLIRVREETIPLSVAAQQSVGCCDAMSRPTSTFHRAASWCRVLQETLPGGPE